MKEAGWLFLDLNSYFASVEQEVNVEMRGKPIGVVPTMAETTCCIAASIQAKNFGVKTGTIVAEARKMCPGIIFVHADHRRYIDYHNRIVEAVESCHPVTQVLSIDEMGLKLSGRDRNLDNALKLSHEIRAKVLQVGSQLRCSIGIAPNKYLSKIASDMQKPDGLTVLLKEDLPHSLAKLKLRDLPGIGERMEKRLEERGVKTMEKLISLDKNSMHSMWGGIWGERIYEWIRGEDFEDARSSRAKSIGHSHVLAPEFRTMQGAYGVLIKLIHKAATRLRAEKGWAQKFYISVRFTNQTKWYEEVKIHECQDTHTFLEILQKLWKTCPHRTPIKVSVTFLDLIFDDEKTNSFFDNEKRISISNAMDKLNSKYKKNLVYPAGMHVTKKSAPTRIAFTNIPDVSIFDEDKED